MRGLVLLALLLIGVPLQAQSLEPGTPLRVNARGYTVAGDLVRWETDSLVVRPETPRDDAGLRADRAVALSDILSLKRAVPRARGWGAARGALWGMAAGVLLGAAYGLASAYEGDWCYTSLASALCGAAVIGIPATGIGALIGAVHPGQRWEQVELGP